MNDGRSPSEAGPNVRFSSENRRTVIWCPDWPVYAAGATRMSAAAVFDKGQVLACTDIARHDGVRRGMRKRDAQSRCPQLELFDYEPERDARVFADVLAAVEELSAGVAPIRPGLCALRSPGHYYGGEERSGAVIAEHLVQAGQWDCRIGVADTLFAAEQAARHAAAQETYIVPSRETSAFLGGLPIDALGHAALIDLFHRLGLRTVGDFAGLRHGDVIARFGSLGARMHRMARGIDVDPVAARAVPPEFTETVGFEPPVARSEQLAFSLRRPAERFISRLADHGSVCTTVRIGIDTDRRGSAERIWLHPRWFTAADLLDRVRWQVQAGELGGAVSEVRFVPEEISNLGDHADTLFGTGPDEQVDRSIARVQGLLGHESVRSAGIQAGRNPADRQVLDPWGQGRRSASLRRSPDRSSDQTDTAVLPWPDSIPDPAPSRVYAAPKKAAVVASRGEPVRVDGRGMISAEPASFRAGEHWYPVAAWAGPWPVDEHWWDTACARRIARFQIVGVDGSAWLMAIEDGQWWIEAGYD